MLDRLYKYKQDISSAAHRCENLSNTSPEPSPIVQSELTVQATQVNANTNDVIDQLENQLSKLRENMVQLEAVEKMKTELNNWFISKSAELQQMRDKPAKLHVEAAELELSHLEVGKY
jgi:hypothetical protein